MMNLAFHLAFPATFDFKNLWLFPSIHFCINLLQHSALFRSLELYGHQLFRMFCNLQTITLLTNSLLFPRKLHPLN